jgi:hypothetical protein
VGRQEERKTPLKVKFAEFETYLGLNKMDNSINADSTGKLRAHALPILASVDYELLLVTSSRNEEVKKDIEYTDFFESFSGNVLRQPRLNKPNSSEAILSDRVKKFMTEAQIDYRKFFRANELDLLPRIMKSISQEIQPILVNDLRNRIAAVKHRSVQLKRYGLQADDEDFNAIGDILETIDYTDDPKSLAISNTYIEVQENAQKRRDLISNRLEELEKIMSEFLTGKTIRVDFQVGLEIITSTGSTIRENQLSSGEYNFLYMMGSALLCQRIGSIIAIDERSYPRMLLGKES